MDGMRSSFSRFKKDIKHRLGGKKHAPDRIGANPTRGRTDTLDSPLRPDNYAAASGHDEEGSRISTDVLQARSRDIYPQPEAIPVGNDNGDPQRRETGVDEKEAGQRGSYLDPDIQAAGESGPNQGVYSSQPSPPPRKEEPDST